MSKYATKAGSNIFCRARYEAAKFNDRLYSREGAAEELGIDRTRLARIELGSTAPYPEEILLMAEIYNAPELKCMYCRDMCPLGKDLPKVEIQTLDRISLKALAAFRKISETRDSFLEIVEDGEISEQERPQLENVLQTLNEVVQISQNLKIWVDKNLK